MGNQIKVLLCEPIRPVGMAYLEQEAELVISPDSRPETVAGIAGDCDAIISRNTRIDALVFDRAPKLKVVSSHGVGYDQVDVEGASARGIYVVNTPGANSQSVAEITVGFMLMLSRKTGTAHEVFLRDRDFSVRNKFIGQDIFGKTILIAGAGFIGRKLAKICKAGFEMKVLCYDPFVTEAEMTLVGMEKMQTLEEGLPQSDFVSLNCPYDDSLHHMIGARQFSMMKPSAYFINCARGLLVDDKALITALKEGVIAGAAIDVFAKEPTDKDDPLFDAPNLIVTPHIGANAADSIDNMSLYSAMDVVAVARGEYDKARIVNREILKLK